MTAAYLMCFGLRRPHVEQVTDKPASSWEFIGITLRGVGSDCPHKWFLSRTPNVDTVIGFPSLLMATRQMRD